MAERSTETAGARGPGRPGVIPPSWAEAPGGVGGRRGRADKPVLSRDAIVEATVRIVDEEGYEAVSMRRVAQEFGTGAASLYAYVANKDQLMDLVVDKMMGEAGDLVPPRTGETGDLAHGIELIKDVVRTSYRVLSAHRDVAKAFLGRVPFGPNGIRNVEVLLALLREYGFPDQIAAYAGDLIGQYIVGAAIEDYMWRERYPDATEDDVRQAMDEVADYLESLPKDEFPNVTSMARIMMGPAGGEIGDRFELGLDILMRGLASFVQS